MYSCVLLNFLRKFDVLERISFSVINMKTTGLERGIENLYKYNLKIKKMKISSFLAITSLKT